MPLRVLVALGAALVACSHTPPTTTRASSDKPELLAVIDFESPDQSANIDELLLLTDGLRSAVVSVTGARFKVLTRETMMEIVPPSEMRCFAEMCAAQLGRRLQAPFVMTGSVRQLNLRKVLTIEIYESSGGRLLGSMQLKAGDADGLLDEIEGQAGSRVRQWLGLAPDAGATTAAAPPVEAPTPSPKPRKAAALDRSVDELITLVWHDLIARNINVPPEKVRRARYQAACAEGEAIGCQLASAPVLPLENWSDLNFPPLNAACERGRAVSCIAAAEGQSTKTPGGITEPQTAPNPTAAIAAARKMCEILGPAGCVEMGFLVGAGVGTAKAEESAVGFYERACEAGRPEACHYLAGKARGESQLKLHQRSCDAGIADACSILADYFTFGPNEARDHARAIALNQRLCEKSIGAGCRGLGVRTRKGLGVAKDDVKSHGYFEQSCRLKDPAGCNWVAMDLADGTGVVKDEPRAFGLYERGCRADNAFACRQSGWMHGFGRGTPQNSAAALERYRKACSLGDGTGCNFAAQLIEQGNGVAKNPVDAANLNIRACDLNFAPACVAVAKAFHAGTEINKDEASAQKYFASACLLGNGEGCREGGLMREVQKQVDETTADFFERGCQADDALSCWKISLLLYEGTGVAKNEARSLETATKGCELGHVRGCYSAGWLHANGTSPGCDKNKARAFLEKTCTASEKVGCNLLGILLANAAGGPSDPTRAVDLFKAACEARYADGCTSWGEALEKGVGAPANRSTAIAKYRKACGLGGQPACARLDELGVAR